MKESITTSLKPGNGEICWFINPLLNNFKIPNVLNPLNDDPIWGNKTIQPSGHSEIEFENPPQNPEHTLTTNSMFIYHDESSFRIPLHWTD